MQPGLALYYEAFFDLTTCRGMGFGSVGPIPWTAIVEYARFYRFDEEQTDALLFYVRRLDDVVIKKSTPAKDTAPANRVAKKR